MLGYLKLSFAAFIPVLASLFFYYLKKKERFAKLNYWTKQIIIGVVYGGIAIIGTEWGIKINDYVVNSRDAAPLAAGLLFGGPAGIIAGIIGGLERWFAVYWGAGSFTRVACSVSTMLAGVIAAFLRRFLFEKKRPTWGIALGVGVTMEVFHLTMVMVTNIQDATKAVDVIDTCLLPMSIANGLSVMLSTLFVAIYAGDYKSEGEEGHFFRKSNKERPIFETIQRWLLLVLAIVFIGTLCFQRIMQRNMVINETKDLISSSLDSISKDISDASDAYMLQFTRKIAREISYGYKYNLNELANTYDFTEISVINKEGIITESNNPEYIGFDMYSGEQSAQFTVLLDNKDEVVQAYGPIAMDQNVFRKFAGVAIRNHSGFVQTAYDTSSFQKIVSENVKRVADNRRVGDTGGIIVLDKNLKLVSISSNLDSKQYKNIDYSLIENQANDGIVHETEVDEEMVFLSCRSVEGYYIVAFYPEKEAVLSKSVALYESLFSMTIIFSTMFILIYMLIKYIVVNQIMRMADSLAVISEGNLDEVVDVRSNKEFSSLSDDINATVNTLKRYIAEAAARIDKELEFAKSIQMSALPEPVSLDDRYDIYAFMKTAKEVGGDFYDFYMTKDNILHFLIADVSGKGIPAAMFMMRSKSVLKSLSERGLSVDDVFTSGNDALCHENDAGMFVTAWQGDLDLRNGSTYFANAGHNLPAVKKKGGKFELIKQKVNLVLGGMEGLPYNLSELQLEPGDVVFLYTDGVTEATNAQEELFGDDRLVEALNCKEYESLKDLCDGVMNAIDDFVKDADQFDDITMVAVEYKG